ncbi:DUF1254 domain-containing protein [Cohaesibacter haloalkalitolerans]|uniref:DUF1254 domain-containing protein n=1 Tax=Cohaesibacter haloalkalitolerans TaxID=1162980 RepID=UPI000E6539C6|nr:hypothetical protein [Cohaesibacter haloalkalitolerans]
MIRETLIFFAALVVGAIIHIVTIFALPYFAENDIWNRVLQIGPVHTVHVISNPKQALDLSGDLDPTFAFAICRTDVSQAPVLFKGRIPSDFWSLDYVDRNGRSQFSLTNQISGSTLNVVLATKGQQRLMSERPDLVDETAIVISATEDKGFLLVRALVASERDRDMIANGLSHAACSPLWTEETFQ